MFAHLMKSHVPVLALPIALTLGLMTREGALAGAREQQAQTEDVKGQIAFPTLDNDVAQVTVEQIWRVREATPHDEPAGAIVIDYGFERVFVKDTLDNVIEKIRQQRDLRKFTLPSGAPIYIAPDKVIGINRPIPAQHHQNSKSIIVAREGQQQVQESRQTISDALR